MLERENNRCILGCLIISKQQSLNLSNQYILVLIKTNKHKSAKEILVKLVFNFFFKFFYSYFLTPIVALQMVSMGRVMKEVMVSATVR
jgi:hypothetical protein